MPSSLAEPARTTAVKKSKKAHKRLNMDDGFPFAGKWDMPRLMTEIHEAVAEDDMPPESYMKKSHQSGSDPDFPVAPEGAPTLGPWPGDPAR